MNFEAKGDKNQSLHEKALGSKTYIGGVSITTMVNVYMKFSDGSEIKVEADDEQTLERILELTEKKFRSLRIHTEDEF